MLIIRITQWFLLTLYLGSFRDFIGNWKLSIGQLMFSYRRCREQRIVICWRQRHIQKRWSNIYGEVWGYSYRIWAFWRRNTWLYHGDKMFESLSTDPNERVVRAYDLTWPSLHFHMVWFYQPYWLRKWLETRRLRSTKAAIIS